MHLFTSNRLEHLLEHLAGIVRARPLPPLCTETIVVQSKGMERWLALQLAARLGIWANAECPFPGALTWRMFRAALDNVPDVSAYDPAHLQWTVMKLLPRYLERVEFRELRRYLQDDTDGLKRYQLSQRIADTFDQYVVYRPDWILGWEKKPPPHWQGRLWNAIREEYAERAGVSLYEHRAALWQRLLAQLRRADFDTSSLPPRLSVFGISSLPPFYMAMFDELSRHLEVNLFILNPCGEYWGLIKSDAEIARISMRENPPLEPEEEYLETGNPLLASMGKLGRDFLDMLTEFNPREHEAFEEPAQDTLLAQLQRDILNLHDRTQDGPQPDGEKLEKYVIRADDLSVQIHNCHSPMREVEVLHDRLSALFEAEPELTPGDVLVMSPDIETYAPLIQAVFATTPDPARRIPFSIADRGARSENQLYEAFFLLLELAAGRLPLGEVLDLLQVPAVQERFGLGQHEVETVQDWLAATGVRWGIDAADRGAHGLPELDENTWRFGLQRLLLGYALPGDGETLFHGILPLDRLEGGEAQVLGAFMDFAEALFSACRTLRPARTLEEWQTVLLQLVDDFFAPRTEDALVDPATQRQLQGLRGGLVQLAGQALPAAFTEQVSLPVIKSWLARHLEEGHTPSGFITGSVTFCEMLPMRSIPFQVVCLVGLHDRAYPRVRRAPGFDLMARHPRRGDRSRRNDDRYLFLEALLSARTHWYLSYAGQSVQDNSEIPPSVLISELLQYLEGSCVVAECRSGFVTQTGAEPSPPTPLPEGEELNVTARLLTRHPLQAFSRRYFDGSDPKLFSYAGEYLEASSTQTGPNMAEPLLPAALPAEAAPAEIHLTELLRFFRNPCRYLLENRLDIRLSEGVDVPEDAEPFALGGLERYRIDVELLDKALSVEDPEELAHYYPVLKAAGVLPLGQVGSHTYAGLSREALAFAARLRPFLHGEILAPLDTHLNMGTQSMHGRIVEARGRALVRYRPATVKPIDLLGLWLHHLFLNAAGAQGYPRTSIYLGTDKGWRLPPVRDAGAQLHRLTGLFRRGLHKPLLFFPQASFIYIEALRKQESPALALRRAEQAWLGAQRKRGEGEDLYYRRCFRERVPLQEPAFVELAEAVYGPLLERLEGTGDKR